MNELIVKQFESRDIRIVFDQDNNPNFVAQDVMKELGIKHQAHALSKLKDNQRGFTNLDTLGGKQQFATVTESGLYALVFQSRKAEALDFQDWVTDVVIPSIRKTGSYSVEPVDEFDRNIMMVQGLLQSTIENRNKIRAMAKTIETVEVKTVQIESKVVENTHAIESLSMRRSGKEPIPQGTITATQIRNDYFINTIPEDKIREYLAAINHPFTNYVYVTPTGAEIASKAFHKQGLDEAITGFLNSCRYLKETPQKYMFTNKHVSSNFGFNKDRLKGTLKEQVLRKINLN